MRDIGTFFATLALVVIMSLGAVYTAIHLTQAYKAFPLYKKPLEKRTLNEEDPNLTPAAEPEEQEESIIVRGESRQFVPSRQLQLCPGPSKLAYPSRGICVSGRVYAKVNRAIGDGGFYLLRPGRYSSSAIGSDCNFTVGNNCQVSSK